MFKQLFFCPRFLPQTPCVIVYKMYECDKNQMPYLILKNSKNQTYENFGLLIKHGPQNFNNITFISEKNRNFRGLCKNLEQNYFI